MSVFQNIFNSAKKLLGSGRAFNLVPDNFNEFYKSLLQPTVDARQNFVNISKAVFPWLLVGVVSDNELEPLIKDWESQFKVIPPVDATLTERADALRARWSTTGSLSAKELQRAFDAANIPVFVKENIPAQTFDLDDANVTLIGNGLITLLVIPRASWTTYSSWSTFRDWGNVVSAEFEDLNDPVNDPVETTQWQKMLIIEGEDWEEVVSLTNVQFQTLLDILLKSKRASIAALIRATNTG